MDYMGRNEMVEALKELNPTVTFFIPDEEIGGDDMIVAECDNLESLALPDSFYLSPKNGLTNKHRTPSGWYECFELVTVKQLAADGVKL